MKTIAESLLLYISKDQYLRMILRPAGEAHEPNKDKQVKPEATLFINF
jgi:hypothetical protein